MHMADALLSPGVGLTFGAAAAGTIALAAHKVRLALDDHKTPLMGVLGAFVFAAQMINFTIPGTGSSGHLGGGLLLAILLGPWAAFLTIASVLVIQALFFADGGLLALGTNVLNLGGLPCFLGLPLFRALAGKSPAGARFTAAATCAAVVGLEAGAFAVVLETLLSGRSELTFGPFLALMAGIHLPIGVIEGLVTAAVVGYVFRLRPELAVPAFGDAPAPGPARSLRPVVVILALAALVAGGLLSWFASTNPDGLEWSIERVTGGAGLRSRPAPLSAKLEDLQRGTAPLPDYALPPTGVPTGTSAPGRPSGDAATSLSGVIGAAITLLLAAGLGFLLTRRRNRAAAP
jgi:cobalt/nickel transport system permease protein